MNQETGSVNRAALVAMILGIVALALSLVVVGGLIGLAAVVVGIVAATRPGRKGMSITGIVTGAMAMMLGFVGLFVWAAVVVPRMTGRVGMARHNATVAEMANLKNALTTFEIDNGRYPTTAEGLEALVVCPPGLKASWHRLIDSVPVDKWGHPYVYRFPGGVDPQTFDLTSMGPDGVLGTGDDIEKDHL